MPGEPYSIKLKPNPEPVHPRPFPIPQKHLNLMNGEVNHLIELGLLRQANDLEWAAPSFGIPEKDNTILFVSDFTGLNKHVVRHPFPLPSIQDTIRIMSKFTYCTTLEMNMGYWSIPMLPELQRICTIILPWGKFSYTCLPIGLAPSPDVYQEKMSLLFIDLEEVKVYFDHILVLGFDSLNDHLLILQEVSTPIRKANLQVNVAKSKFAAIETEYLVFNIFQQGV